MLACAIILVWGISGPFFHFSDTRQLVINTGATIMTFLMVFLIQNTQNRDMTALRLKLDELIRASDKARDRLITLEDMTGEELDRLKGSFSKMAGAAPEGTPARAVVEGLEAAREGIERVGQNPGVTPGRAP